MSLKTIGQLLFNEEKHGPKLDSMVSISQILQYLKCGMAWRLSYGERLTRRVERPYLTTGKLCHSAMQGAWQYMYETQHPKVKFRAPPATVQTALEMGIAAMVESYLKYKSENVFLEEEIPMLEQTLEDAKRVFIHAWGAMDPGKYRVYEIKTRKDVIPAIELHFVIPCHGSRGMHGFIDAILEDVESNNIWSVDFKFRKSLATHEDEESNLQNLVYIAATSRMGLPITGSMTWQHLNSPPSFPALLKDGKSLSRAKIKTDWETYMAYALSLGIDPEPYREEMSEKLAEIEWFRETKEYRNEQTVQTAFDTIIIPAVYNISSCRKLLSIQDGTCKGYTSLTPMGRARLNRYTIPAMFPWNCKQCEFPQICQAKLRGYDVDFIKSSEFKTRPTAAERLETEKEEQDNAEQPMATT